MRLLRILATFASLFLVISCGDQDASPRDASTSHDESSSQSQQPTAREVETSPAPEPEPEPEPEPDGYICFISQDSWDDDYPSLYVLDTMGNIEQVHSPRNAQISWISELEWNPNAESIAALGRRGGVENIFIIDLSTGQCERLTNIDDNTAISDISWSPNGGYLAYTQVDISDMFSNKREIAVIDLSRGQSTEITSTQGRASEPRWSSDSEVIYYSYGRDISAVSVAGSDVNLQQEAIDSAYRSQRGLDANFDYGACEEYWDRSGEVSIHTPRWSNATTFLDRAPLFFGPAISMPSSNDVIRVISLEGGKYFCRIHADTYECTVLEAKSHGGYPYQSSADDIRWINDDEFLFFGNRDGLEGFAILNTSTGSRRWLVNNRNAQYDFKTWDYTSNPD